MKSTLKAAFIVALTLFAADTAWDTRAQAQSETTAEAENRRDALFEALKGAKNELEANQIADQIWRSWFVAPDATAEELMAEAQSRRSFLDYATAVKVLTQLIEHAPDYSEAYNQRATMYFHLGDFDASLADVERTLALEPRHFGALAGKAIMLIQLGRHAEGQAALREALEIHPFLVERHLLTETPGQDL